MENTSKEFPVPLWVGWAVNVLGWLLFVATFNHAIELITGILCAGCVYVGYVHKNNGSEPALGMDYLTAERLIYASGVEAIWMFAWAFGIFDY